MCGEKVAACECQHIFDSPLTHIFHTAEAIVASHERTSMLEHCELVFAELAASMQCLD